jgi:type IV pilus assembly protein PilM
MSDSIWKKELSFKRKPKPDLDPDFVLPEGEPAKQSFLKKEISLSRKPKEPKAAKEPKPAKQSIWKKEISFGGKQEKTVEQLVQEATAAVSAEPLPVAPDPPAAPPTELAEAVVAAMPDPSAAAPVVEDVHPVESLPVGEPAPVVGLSPAILAASAEPEPAPAPPLPPETWAAPAAVPAAEQWEAAPELPPAPVAPEPVVVHPPVPAAELPPIVAEKPQPFWKREVSLSRRPKQPKPPKEPKAGGAAPFWKRELSFSRKAKPAVEPEAETAQLPAAKKPPLWKRQVKLGMPALSLSGFSLPNLPSGGKGGHAAKRLVGLKIGASQIAAARVSNNGVAELQQLARDPLAPGVVVAGELRDPEALGDALKAFFARHKLPKKGVRLGIASNRIGVRVIDIVGVDEDKQLANAVQFRAQEALPIPLDEAVLDYQVLDQTVDAEGQTVKRVLLVVAYRELVDRYVSACRKAGITLTGIDLEAFALLRALGAPADRGGSALVAVSIGHDRSTFAVSDGRICEFTRVVEWGGSALNVALARAFDSTPSEVEHIKRELSLDGSIAPEGLTPEQTSVALDAVRRQVQSFARELVSSLQFYQNQPGSLGIGEIVLTGGTAQMPGLAQELQGLIGVHVRIGDPLARLKVAKKVGQSDQIGSLAVAIGLGIED